MRNSNETVSRPGLSLKSQVDELNLSGARDVSTTVRSIMNATMGEALDLQCNWLGTSGKTAVSIRRFAGVTISKLIQ